MSTHTIADLRSMRVDTLEALKNKEEPLEIERALAIKDVAQVIVNSAKVEVDHMRIAGGLGSGFLAPPSQTRPPLIGEQVTEPTGHGSKTITQLGNGATVTRHRMGG